ncbi:MAG: class I SAM-dependent methyltransferase [bacterium]|nr:class I SAM-dependent methyltransferase [bacterium]
MTDNAELPQRSGGKTTWTDRTNGFRAIPFEPSPDRLAAARRQRRRGRRLGWLKGDTIFDRIRVDVGLRFLHEVVGLKGLSYGLWEGEPQSLEGLKAAQNRYAKTLCDWVPHGVRRILDVGCGTGETARKLTERGFEVEGLSPDPYLGEVFTARTGLPFHLIRYERFHPERPFDLVIMSESAQYILLDQLFRWVMRESPGAYLLVSDYFTVEPADGPLGQSGHPLSDFEDEARLWAFEELRREDVTDAVVPTLELSRLWLDRYVIPTAELVQETLARRSRLLVAIGRILLRGQVTRWKRQVELGESREFMRQKRYLRLLFRSPESMGELQKLRA